MPDRLFFIRSLVSQMHDLLTKYAIKCILQRLEILNRGETKQPCLYVNLSIKLIGRLNREELSRHFHTKFTGTSFMEKQKSSSHAPSFSLAIIDLTTFSSPQQMLEMQKHITQEDNYRPSFSPNETANMQVFCLQETCHILHLTLYQPQMATASTNLLVHEIVNRFCLSNEIEQNNLASNLSPNGQLETASLTLREMEVLQCAAEGFSNHEIAQQCVITEGTVKRHMNNIYNKLTVSSRTQAIARAKKLQLLSW